MDEPTCTVADCRRPLYVKKHGVCTAHYQKMRKYGDPLGGVVPQFAQPCTFDGCDVPRRYDQLCMGHYTQRRLGKTLTPLRRFTDATIRDDMGRKQCRRCDRWLHTAEFSMNKARKDGLTAYCRRYERDKALIHNYGITIDQHEAMLAAQGGGCAICGGQTKDGRAFFVDHDHACCPGSKTCGQCVRGLLCGECNLGIGYFGDDIARIERAIAYLRDGASVDTTEVS
ncbi:hypothetical protein M2155_000598 [Streptomyces sp. SAI-119]|uniref:endonuclease VII domain-containing protein n=1 Tax=Streptomyces sp. SAI-119 TaxID=2940541 RepID=UPI002476A1C3|nr:endonuclease VII domain-containing protein [Streptomyces sp. SAI-119]MDH6448190.1 hypothetical protein [Streptomyces sp. SAI-119]